MSDFVYITGNQNKARMLSELLALPLEHHKVDVTEIQSLNLQEVVEHKVREAYQILKKPVVVEDTSLEFEAFGRFPGTFIKYFTEEVSGETICRSLDSLSRRATVRVMFGYYDGTEPVFIESAIHGTIADHPSGDGGFGFDTFFIAAGFSKTNASLDEATYKKVYLRMKPIEKLRVFLVNRSQ
jgi:non-canonical purine NTP pyrophosphatase (RdgB/HAM1 family)